MVCAIDESQDSTKALLKWFPVLLPHSPS